MAALQNIKKARNLYEEVLNRTRRNLSYGLDQFKIAFSSQLDLWEQCLNVSEEAIDPKTMETYINVNIQKLKSLNMKLEDLMPQTEPSQLSTQYNPQSNTQQSTYQSTPLPSTPQSTTQQNTTQQSTQYKAPSQSKKYKKAQDSDQSDELQDMYHDIPQVSVSREEIKQPAVESYQASQRQSVLSYQIPKVNSRTPFQGNELSQIQHFNNQIISCPICIRSFKTRDELVKHGMIKHPGQTITVGYDDRLDQMEKDEEHNCWKCDVKSKSLKMFRSHLKKHGIISTFTCPPCDLRFENCQTLASHLIDIHAQKQEQGWHYFCNATKRIITKQNSLEVHVLECMYYFTSKAEEPSKTVKKVKKDPIF